MDVRLRCANAQSGEARAPLTMRRQALDELIAVRAEIQDALSGGRAVVALESTIIAHGMPYPQNVETARALEAIVRRAGAIPATIAVVEGGIKVGLDEAELERFATAKGVVKASRRDLSACIVAKATAGTTVAATMAIAASAASKSSGPAGSAACIAARRRLSMSPLT